ncbi:MAG: hypothetical protein BWK75_00730 [Candidatus Altiarchaeales archaeon A3]|nr:MAG: hypothetical protein BWK75_00730 [Candidatus Altiarchaeales archaeon A3]
MDLIKLFMDTDWNIQILVSKWLILITVVAIIVWFLCLKFFKELRGKVYEIDEATIGIGSNTIKIKPNYEDMQVAYKLWVELSTRKIGMPIDFENDVIVELYNSWYEFFKITRELIKCIPVSKVRKNESTREIVRIVVEVLNDGIRPNLTKWQAKFRRWYENESNKKENEKLTPQQIQQNFPEYKQVVIEMREVNEKLIKYRKILRQLAIGGDK